MAVLGHSGSQAPQLMHSSVIMMAIAVESGKVNSQVHLREQTALGGLFGLQK